MQHLGLQWRSILTDGAMLSRSREAQGLPVHAPQAHCQILSKVVRIFALELLHTQELANTSVEAQ